MSARGPRNGLLPVFEPAVAFGVEQADRAGPSPSPDLVRVVAVGDVVAVAPSLLAEILRDQLGDARRRTVRVARDACFERRAHADGRRREAFETHVVSGGWRRGIHVAQCDADRIGLNAAARSWITHVHLSRSRDEQAGAGERGAGPSTSSRSGTTAAPGCSASRHRSRRPGGPGERREIAFGASSGRLAITSARADCPGGARGRTHPTRAGQRTVAS